MTTVVRAARGAAAVVYRAAPGHVVLLTGSALAGAGAPVLAAWLTRVILDRISAGVAMGTLATLAAGLAAAGLVTAVLPQLDQYWRAELDRAGSLQSTDELYRAVDDFVGLARFEDPTFADRLRMAAMATKAPAEAVGAGLAALRAALTLAGFVGSLAVISPVMTAVVFAAAVPALLAELAVSHRRVRTLWTIGPAQRREMFYSTLLSNAPAAKEIRLFGIGALLRTRMLAERRRADAEGHRTDRRELAVQGGLLLLGAVVAGAGLIWTIRGAAAGGLSVGDVSMFVAAVAGTQTALTSFISQMATAHQRLLLFDHHLTVRRAGPDLPVPAQPVPAPPLRRGIEFDNVWFRYGPAHPWTLRGLSLYLTAGYATALVGRNGAGKSTIVKLLCRLYDPTHGSIRWDGVDIRRMDPASLRRRVAAVFQDFVQYDLTAAENIGLGDVTAAGDRARVVASAKRAGVHPVLVGLPAGYDTMLSRVFAAEADAVDLATGVSLSGGQWQRVALARALIRDRPDLMVLDEPSSGLDAEAEHEIHTTLRYHRAGRTSLLISHRLAAVRDADYIVVINEGVLVEHGTHDWLMALGGTYATLFSLQAAGYADAGMRS
jgi:ATP-binding cassette subfamily B protein